MGSYRDLRYGALKCRKGSQMSESTGRPVSLNTLDRFRAELEAKHPRWRIWYAPAIGGTIWCAHPLPVLTEGASADLDQAMTAATRASAERDLGRPLPDLAPDERVRFLDVLSDDERREMCTFVAKWAPEVFDAAIAARSTEFAGELARRTGGGGAARIRKATRR